MKKRILLVDDKAEFRKLVKVFLMSKYDIETAENGLKAMALLQSGYVPDLIVTDLMMPDVDGYSLVSQVKSSGVFRDIPVIVLSSMDKSTDKITLLKLGANDYLIKPFNPEELELRIDNIFHFAAKKIHV